MDRGVTSPANGANSQGKKAGKTPGSVASPWVEFLHGTWHPMFSALRSARFGFCALAASLVFATAACSESIAKNARDDRTNSAGPAGSSETAGTPTGTGGPARCTEAAATTQLEPVYIMFVVDGSATMNEYGKWSAVTDSVKLIVEQVAGNQDASVGIGMIGFADSIDPTESPTNQGMYGPYPTSSDVPIRYVDATQAEALRARLGGTPKGLTPTFNALDGAYKALRSFTPPAPLQGGGRKIVVLITDGLPYSASAPGVPFTAEEQMAYSVKAAEDNARAADPILTFAVGVGSFPGDSDTYDPRFLGRIAAAGGTRRAATCDPFENTTATNVCHFQVTPGVGSLQDLREAAIDAINSIRQQTVSCNLKVNPPPAGFELDSHTISVRTKSAGKTSTILPSATNGWSVDNAEKPTVVTLNGEACQNFRKAGGQIEVLLACK